MSTLVDKIRSRGYWQVVIRPTRFVEKRVPEIRALYPIVQKSSVLLRGWDFPHIDSHNDPHIDVDWVGQESEWDAHLEAWRIYQSGLFADILGMHYDWRDQSGLFPAPKDWVPGQLLGVIDAIYRLTEIMEFAARLALSEAGDERMYVEIVVGGLKGRRLWVDDRNRTSFFAEYAATIDEFPHRAELQRSELVGNPRELALKVAQELFWRFNWEAPIDILTDMQAGLRK